jgi:hypothetical protein
MRDRDRRNQNPSIIRAIRGPITLITLGSLFALNNFTQYSFDRTWPVLLIVFGLLSLLRRSIEPVPVPLPQPPAAPFPPPQYSYPYNTPPQPATPQPSFAQSTYAQVPPAKGGFGASAARPIEGASQSEPGVQNPADPNGGQL